MTMNFLTTYDRRRSREPMYYSADGDVLMVKDRICNTLFSYGETSVRAERGDRPTITFNITKIPYVFPEYGLNIFQSSTALYSLECLQLI